jgi:nitrite reductase/ring-hydroxylating ferredoxin subunit
MVEHVVGTEADFPLDEMRIVEIEGRSVGVIRTPRGFFAMLNRCPHQLAEICRGQVGGTMLPSRPQQYEFSDEALVVRCPWHRWEFELSTGRSFGATTRRRLMTFDVEVKDGSVVVKMRKR